MFDYSRAIFDKTKKDLETALAVYQFGTQILYISYLIYLLLTPNLIWYLHIPLLAISIAFFVFDIITSKSIRAIKSEKVTFRNKRLISKRLANAKKHRSNIKKIKFYASHFIKLFVLAYSFYPIIVAPTTVHPLSIMCTTVMVLLWILQIVFEVLKLVLEGRGELFMEALHADVEFVTKPVDFVKGAFNKIRGKEVEEKPEPTKERKYLDGLVQSIKDEKAAKKAEEKASKNEKLSSWLDSHISKLTSKRGAKANTDIAPSDEGSLAEAKAEESQQTE